MEKLILFWIIFHLGNILNGQTIEIIGNGNLRSGPSTKNEIIGKVTIGMHVKQLGYSNNWYKVEISDKLSGWINETLVKVEKQNRNELKIIQQTIDDYIVLITFMQYNYQACPFAYNKKISKYAQDKLFETVKKYEMGNPNDSYILPHGILAMQTDNINYYKAYPNVIWFDVLDELFESRGNFPKIEIKNPDYDIRFIHSGNYLITRKDEEDVDTMKIIYEDGMEIRLNNIVWIYKNNMWIKE